MRSEEKDLLRILVKAYAENNLEKTVDNIISSKIADTTLIAQICGVDVVKDDNFIEDLKIAIKNYSPHHKVVTKIKDCSHQCKSNNNQSNCEKSCPFNAIIRDAKAQTTVIDKDKCTDCGLCVDACSTGCIVDKIEFIPVLELLKNNTQVVAAVAPAIIGQFGENVSMGQLRAAFKMLGFLDMVEVSFFADMLTLKEAIEFDHLVKKKEDLMITSCCCPMWVGMLKKVYGNLIKHVSPSISPMIAAGRILKQLNPNCKVVFVGPCIAKKAEAKEKDIAGAIDFVLTFSELNEIFQALNIYPENLDEIQSPEYASKGGRLYARTGGVSIAVSDALKKMFPEKHKFFKAIQANGVKECKDILTKAQAGEIDANFIEGMGCIGGCVGGPKSIIPKESGKIFVDDYAENSEIKVSVDSTCMLDILSKIQITCKEDFKDESKIEIFQRKF